MNILSRARIEEAGSGFTLFLGSSLQEGAVKSFFTASGLLNYCTINEHPQWERAYQFGVNNENAFDSAHFLLLLARLCYAAKDAQAERSYKENPGQTILRLWEARTKEDKAFLEQITVEADQRLGIQTLPWLIAPKTVSVAEIENRLRKHYPGFQQCHPPRSRLTPERIKPELVEMALRCSSMDYDQMDKKLNVKVPSVILIFDTQKKREQNIEFINESGLEGYINVTGLKSDPIKGYRLKCGVVKVLNEQRCTDSQSFIRALGLLLEARQEVIGENFSNPAAIDLQAFSKPVLERWNNKLSSTKIGNRCLLETFELIIENEIAEQKESYTTKLLQARQNAADNPLTV